MRCSFFFSGISGLVYQVVWVREFGNVFGNTVRSAALRPTSSGDTSRARLRATEYQ